MTPEIIVQLREASKVYRMGEVDVVALKPTNLEVRFGEFVVVLGPSGCGKTTLMNLIGGLDTPTSGQVVIAGRDIGALNAAELTLFRREQVGFVFQFFNLVNTLTARENVQLAADLVRNPMRVEEALEAVGLGERADHFPSELSGGEQQRVAIARALVKQSPLTLCDEPTGELDFETGRMILSLLHETTHARHQTVIMVTHNAAIGAIADRVLRLRSGEIVADELVETPIDPMEVKW